MTQADSQHPEADDSEMRQVEQWVSKLLLIGVLVSLGLVVIGTIISFAHHRDYFRDAQSLKTLTLAGAEFPHTLRGIGAGIVGFQGQSIVICGLLLLIATPVLRVAVSILAFVRAKDRYFVIITSIVLVMLILSFFLGLLMKGAPV